MGGTGGGGAKVYELQCHKQSVPTKAPSPPPCPWPPCVTAGRHCEFKKFASELPVAWRQSMRRCGQQAYICARVALINKNKNKNKKTNSSNSSSSTHTHTDQHVATRNAGRPPPGLPWCHTWHGTRAQDPIHRQRRGCIPRVGGGGRGAPVEPHHDVHAGGCGDVSCVPGVPCWTAWCTHRTVAAVVAKRPTNVWGWRKG